MRFTPKKITILIAGMVFTAGLAAGFVIPAFAGDPVDGLDITIEQIPGGRVSGKNYNSSLSNKSVGQIRMEVGDVLLRHGVGGAEINKVTDALEGGGVYEAELKSFLIAIGINEEGVQKILAEFDMLGIGTTGGTPQSAPEGQIDSILPSGKVSAPAAGATPQPADTGAKGVPSTAPVSTSLTDTAIVKKIELMRNTIEKIQERLKGCGTKVCITVGDHAKYRAGVTNEADKAIKAGKSEEAVQSLRTVKRIIEGDIELLAATEDKGLIADMLGLERALLNQIDSTLTDLRQATGCKNDSQCSAGNICFKGLCIPAPPVKGGGDPLKGLNISHACPKGGCPKKEAFHDTQTDIIRNIRAAAPEERESLKEDLKANRKVFLTEIVSMNLTTRENAKALREDFRENVKTTIGHVDHGKTARIAVAHGKGLRMLNRFRSAMARFDHILDRLESRIAKIRIEIETEERAATGKTNSTFPPKNMVALIEEAKNMQVENEAKMEELKAKYESLLLGENAGGVAEEARALATELKTDIENLRAIIIEIYTQTTDYNNSISNSSI